jgi:hypothetical protein
MFLTVVLLLLARLFCAPSFAQSSPKAGAVVSVQISPANPRVAPAGTIQFSATMSGTGNTGVIWSATGGTISATGLFTASNATSTASTATVTATSVAFPAAKQSTNVTFAVPVRLAILSTSLPAAKTSTPYTASLSSSGGTPPYTWSLASGSIPRGLTLSSSGTISGSTVKMGTFPVNVKVTDSNSKSTSRSLSLQVAAASSLNYYGYDGPAELPRIYLQTTLADTPAPGSTISVKAGGDLQSALNNANCGDTILLQAGAIFSGKFDLPAKPCDDQHWIIVRTSAPDSALPPEGTRINPCYAGVASLPARPAFSCPALKNVMAKIVFTSTGLFGPILLQQGANHYRFIGLEITRALPKAHLLDLVATTDDTYSANHLIFDRCWLHGTPTDETKGGVHLSGITYAAILDSYFTDFHCIAISGSCVDSQAINGGGGSNPGGPYKIDGNFLEASGESIMLGGAPGSTSPTDIEVRYNHLYKPPIWQPGAPGFVGGYTGDAFVVKNHLELKNAQRVLFEGNILENTWGGFTQHGFSVVLLPATQGGVCVPCQVTDITFRYNRISHVAGGFDIGNVEGNVGGFAVAGERYSIHDVLLEDVNKVQYVGYGMLVMMLSSSSHEVLNHVSIQHVTAFPDPSSHIMSIQDTVGSMPGFVFANNLTVSPTYPTWSAGGGPTNCAAAEVPITVIKTCFPWYVFTSNVLIGDFSKYPPSEWPAGQAAFLSSVNKVGFADYAAGNYALSDSSPYKSKGTDGRDIGADIAGLNTSLAGVE